MTVLIVAILIVCYSAVSARIGYMIGRDDREEKRLSNEPRQTHGQFIADLIEKYLDHCERADRSRNRKQMRERAKHNLAEGLDDSFAELIPPN